MSDMDFTAELPSDLVELLERELMPLDLEAFWERADAVALLLPPEGDPPPDVEGRRERARAKLPAEVLRAVEAFVADPGDDFAPYELRDLLAEWETLRLDEEKLLGHLLIGHGDTAAVVLAFDHDDRVTRHARLHVGDGG